MQKIVGEKIKKMVSALINATLLQRLRMKSWYVQGIYNELLCENIIYI